MACCSLARLSEIWPAEDRSQGAWVTQVPVGVAMPPLQRLVEERVARLRQARVVSHGLPTGLPSHVPPPSAHRSHWGPRLRRLENQSAHCWASIGGAAYAQTSQRQLSRQCTQTLKVVSPERPPKGMAGAPEGDRAPQRMSSAEPARSRRARPGETQEPSWGTLPMGVYLNTGPVAHILRNMCVGSRSRAWQTS